MQKNVANIKPIFELFATLNAKSYIILSIRSKL